jgi:hypothetical protein
MNDCSTVTSACTTEDVYPTRFDYQAAIEGLLKTAAHMRSRMEADGVISPDGFKERELTHSERLVALARQHNWSEARANNHVREYATASDPAGSEYLKRCVSTRTLVYCRRPSEVRDHFTVRIGGTRQTGKTRTIHQMAGASDWVVVVNLAMFESFKETHMRLWPMRTPPTVFTARTIREMMRNALSPDPVVPPGRIFIDDASCQHCGFSDSIYTWVGRHLERTPWIVEVG